MSESYTEYAVRAKGGLLSVFGMQKEYEVIYVDGTLEISAIMNKSRRKRKFVCEMKEVLGFHLGRREDAVRLGKVSRDYSSGEPGRDCCVMKVGTEKGTQVICFEPGEELADILNKKYRILKV